MSAPQQQTGGQTVQLGTGNYADYLSVSVADFGGGTYEARTAPVGGGTFSNVTVSVTVRLTIDVISDVRTVLEGGALETPTAARSQRNLCRVLKESHWYMLLTGDDREWNPTLDTTYSFIVNGFDEMVYEGVVTKVLKNGTTVMAVLEVNQPIGSLAYTRSGEVTIGANMNGLKVSRKALATVSGQTGVWLYDVPGGTFVPVEVLTYQSDGSVLFTPLVDGVLTEGTQVLIK